jgi:hypothetical protein
MENGLYFENFEQSSNWFDSLLQRREEFKKIELFFPLDIIKKITDLNQKQRLSELSVKEKLFRFFNIGPQGLEITINFKHEHIANQDAYTSEKLYFDCFVNPLEFTEKYYQLVNNK